MTNKIIINEKQFNKLIMDSSNSIWCNKDLNSLSSYKLKQYLTEEQGIPNILKGQSINLIKRLNSLLVTQPKENVTINGYDKISTSQLELYPNWNITYIVHYIKNTNYNQVQQANADNNTKTIYLETYQTIGDGTISNDLIEALAHELMHMFQFEQNTNEFTKKNDLYSKCISVFNNLKEGNPIRQINYIIYFSFKDEIEAYNVGGYEWLMNTNLVNKNDKYGFYLKKIFENSPYGRVFERLNRAIIILKYEWNPMLENILSQIYEYSREELIEMGNNALETCQRKFARSFNNAIQKQRENGKENYNK